ncbi:MAG TPA: hypothetical protein DCR93_33425 [Cytophagales bacterium]|nr:hypothetical protein [Cytophagales bacterium]HAP64180.1 hypothetical protein [Cytophagales bacterium]
MKLTRYEVEQFQCLYKMVTKEEISYEEAEKEAMDAVNLYAFSLGKSPYFPDPFGPLSGD